MTSSTFYKCMPAYLIVTFCIAEVLFAKQPRDPLDTPPFVISKAWAIIDGKTGKPLWGHDADVPRKTASTTKMMCAYVILQLAENDPKVMDEVVTFSKLAGTTPGSSAMIKEGEKVPVAECLYGLLLPSGNDAGNAFAEHFNNRFKPLADGELKSGLKLETSTRSNFIAEMNRNAERLGMTHTTYRSPYGDGGEDKDTTSSAGDLLHLAWTAMQNPVFHKYVSTEVYDGHVLQPNGTARTIKWTNTNELLKIEGYDGVKTGTTDLAGRCLVSSCHRDDDHLLCCVLGSPAEEGRYTDTQNLLRWAWLLRGHKPDAGKE